MNWDFIGGVLCGINLGGIVFFLAWKRQRDADREFRVHQIARLDELSEWNTRQYEATRKEIGLPPRRVS